MSAGYSGKPLNQKLGVKPGMRIVALGAPATYVSLLGELPAGARVVNRLHREVELVHLFTKDRAKLESKFDRIRDALAPHGMFWVSWPKRASNVPTDLTEDVVREIALARGLVDVKVAAVDDVWSALKLVIRLKDR